MSELEALANTLQSAFTQLAVAPIMALILGGFASSSAQRGTLNQSPARPAAHPD